jgi:hypothetical protein
MPARNPLCGTIGVGLQLADTAARRSALESLTLTLEGDLEYKMDLTGGNIRAVYIALSCGEFE